MRSITMLPIARRELRVQSRQSKTYYGRLRAAVLGLILIANILFFQSHGNLNPSQVRSAFILLMVVGFIYAMVGGARLTTDCLSEEKRNGTLPFLFLTHLQGYDIVLGKLAAYALPALYALLAVFPIVAILLLFGGLEAILLFEVLVAVLNALFLSLSIGLTTSAIFRNRRASESVAAIVLAILFMILPIASVLVSNLWQMRLLRDVLLFLSPIPGPAVWEHLIQNRIAVGATSWLLTSFWGSILFTHALGWLGIGFAGHRLARSWRETEPAHRLTWRDRLRQWRFGNPGQRLAWRRHCLANNAFYWLAARDRRKANQFWMLLGATLALPLWLAFVVGWETALATMLVAGFCVWYFAPKFLVAAEAARTLAEERRDGTLELVLSTPLPLVDIFRGQWLALRKHYGFIVLFGLGWQLAMILLFISGWGPAWVRQQRHIFLPILLVCLVFYALDILTMGWLGLWYGVSIGDPKKAGHSVAQSVLYFPGFIFLVVQAAGQIVWVLLTGRGWLLSLGGVLSLWGVIGLVNSLGWLYWARLHLQREFRHVAAQPLGKPGALGAWGRWLGQWFARRRAR